MPETLFSDADLKALSANYFELLNLPISFGVDKKELRVHYKALMSKCHPDRFVGESDAQKSAAISATAQVTQAYNTLKSLPQRAAYLLELRGFAVNFNANLSNDPLFLIEQLELRESLEQVAGSKDPDAALASVLSCAQKLEKEQVQSFSTYYEKLTSLNQSKKQNELLQRSQDSVLKLRFLEKLFEEINALQHQLLDE